MSSVPLSKTCVYCGETFPLTPEYFRRGATFRDGFQARCKKCKSKPRLTHEERFWKLVNKTSLCWLWTGDIADNGYGRFGINYKKVYAHRFSYQSTYGDFNSSLHVLHACDNPPCVRPEHLFLGTDSDNMTDKVNKERQLKGEGVGNSKLRNQDVLKIRNLYDTGNFTQVHLAKIFSVSPTLIRHIVIRKIWRHI